MMSRTRPHRGGNHRPAAVRFGVALMALAAAACTIEVPIDSNRNEAIDGLGVGGAGVGVGVGVGGSVVEDIVELDLGQHPEGSFTFEIPDRTLGFTLMVSAASDELVGVRWLSTPTGYVAIDKFGVAGTDFPSYISAGEAAAAVPQSDAPEVNPPPPGIYTIEVGSNGNFFQQMRVRLFTRRSNGGDFYGGVLDINVQIAPGAGISELYMEGVFAQLFGDWYVPAIGIDRGEVGFGLAPSSANTIDSLDELTELLRSTPEGPAPAVNLFVTGDFTGDLDDALGIAGGVPGLPVVHGTGRSGLAIQTQFDKGRDAGVLAHEMGHLAGLFHTTELTGTIFDGLSDTETCPTIQMNPFVCPDRYNVMFPAAYGGLEVSPGQAGVFRASVIYRGALAPGLAPDPPALLETSTGFPAMPEAPQLGMPPARAPKDPFERHMSAHWCTRGGDHRGLAWLHAGDDPVARSRRMLALVLDPDAADIARSRAIHLIEARGTASVRAELAASTEALLAAPRTGRTLARALLDGAARRGELSDAPPAVAAAGDAIVAEHHAHLRATRVKRAR